MGFFWGGGLGGGIITAGELRAGGEHARPFLCLRAVLPP
jgi:hypothetical protein